MSLPHQAAIQDKEAEQDPADIPTRKYILPENFEGDCGWCCLVVNVTTLILLVLPFASCDKLCKRSCHG